MNFLKYREKKLYNTFIFIVFLLAVNERAFAFPAAWEEGLEAHFSLEETSFSPLDEVPQKTEEFLRMLQSGEVAVSKAFYIKDNKAVCVIDTVNNNKLVPEFARPARHSSIAFKEDFPVCDTRLENRLASLASGRVLKRTQTAALPAAPIIVGGIAGCAAGGIYAVMRERTLAIARKSEMDMMDVNKLFEVPEDFMDTMAITLGLSSVGAWSLPKVRPVVKEVLTHHRSFPGMFTGVFGFMFCRNAFAYLLEYGDNGQ